MGQMDDLRAMGDIYARVLDSLDNDDYVADYVKLTQFFKLVQFFIDNVGSEDDAEVLIVDHEPKECRGGLLVKFSIMNVRGANIAELCDTMKICSSIGICKTNDNRIMVSFTVPGIFKRKTE